MMKASGAERGCGRPADTAGRPARVKTPQPRCRRWAPRGLPVAERLRYTHAEPTIMQVRCA